LASGYGARHIAEVARDGGQTRRSAIGLHFAMQASEVPFSWNGSYLSDKTDQSMRRRGAAYDIFADNPLLQSVMSIISEH
jgi:hypothetical protein